MSKTFWLDNPWIYIKKIVNKIRAYFKTEPNDIIWLDNPWLYLDIIAKKINQFLKQD